MHEGFYAPLEGAAVFQEVARASNALPVEVVVDVAWASELISGGCRGPIFLARSPFAPWARASSFGWCGVPSIGEVARVAAIPIVIVPPRESHCDLIRRITEQAAYIAVLPLATRVALESRGSSSSSTPSPLGPWTASSPSAQSLTISIKRPTDFGFRRPSSSLRSHLSKPCLKALMISS